MSDKSQLSEDGWMKMVTVKEAGKRAEIPFRKAVAQPVLSDKRMLCTIGSIRA